MLKIVDFSILFCVILFVSCRSNKDEMNLPIQNLESKIIVENFKLPPIPQEMSFCGEIIDLSDLDIRERLDRELLVNTFYHSSTILYLKRANRFFPQIEKILKEEKLPNDLKYLAVAESGLSQAVSPSGAKGFWQFMPTTAKEYGMTVNEEIDERYHLGKSTYAACAYLKESKQKLNNWFSAIASYNRGVGGVSSDMRWQETNDYFDTYMNNETGRYLFRMMALKLIMENPKLYGFDVDSMELYEPYETVDITIDEGIDDIALWAKGKSLNYKIVKLLNPWILSNSLPKRDTFILELPANTLKLNPRGLKK